MSESQNTHRAILEIIGEIDRLIDGSAQSDAAARKAEALADLMAIAESHCGGEVTMSDIITAIADGKVRHVYMRRA